MLRRGPLHIYGHAHFGTEHLRVGRRARQISRGAIQKNCLRDRPADKSHFKTSGRPSHRSEHGWWLFLRHYLRTKETLIATNSYASNWMPAGHALSQAGVAYVGQVGNSW